MNTQRQNGLSRNRTKTPVNGHVLLPTANWLRAESVFWPGYDVGERGTGIQLHSGAKCIPLL
jgi:hypothetical protein